MKTFTLQRQVSQPNTTELVDTKLVDWRRVVIFKTVTENGKQCRRLHCHVEFK